VDSTVYDFRLYVASQPETPVDSVKVRRDLDSAPTVLRELADEAVRGNIDMTELSQYRLNELIGIDIGGSGPQSGRHRRIAENLEAEFDHASDVPIIRERKPKTLNS
jgi:hypothetical protein